MNLISFRYPTLLIGIILQFNSYAKYDFIGSFGNLNEFVGKIQTDDQGTVNVFSVNPVLNLAVEFEYSPNFIYSPLIGFNFPKSDRDENTSRFNFYALMNLKYKFSDFYLLSGLGIYYTSISGPGGDESLNNGNSVDSFPLPDHTEFARNLIVNLGLGYQFNPEIDFLLHTYIFNIEDKDQRAFSIGTNLNYHFGEFE